MPRAAVLLLCALSGAASAALLDDRGRPVDANTPARRVVALAPHLAELMHDVGAGTALVGVVRGADYPAPVAQLPHVGDAAGIDAERVLALRPDLVLAWGSGNRAADIATLESLGLRVYVNEPRALPDVARTLRAVGALTGHASEGERAARRYESALAALRAPASEAVAVFVQIWDRPLMTVSGAHLISQVLQHCGGRNVFAALPGLAGSVSHEDVLRAHPRAILVLAPPERAAEWSAAWERFERLRGRSVSLDPDLVTRATPRLLRGVEAVCAAVQAWRRQLPRRNRRASRLQLDALPLVENRSGREPGG